ncbi:hypothetical protein [Rubinisphaera italica]|uniref:hypothetical protein n=1 Tax=Rubinisphaera italica TaxID=2527969 RepID=UPI0011B363D5|nr:hypothetical protein [Rubinisphaera italica]
MPNGFSQKCLSDGTNDEAKPKIQGIRKGTRDRMINREIILRHYAGPILRTVLPQVAGYSSDLLKV